MKKKNLPAPDYSQIEDRRPTGLTAAANKVRNAFGRAGASVVEAVQKRRIGNMTEVDRKSRAKIAAAKIKAEDRQAGTKRLRNYNRDRQEDGDRVVAKRARNEASWALPGPRMRKKR
jgi:hypothetical protein